MFFLRLEELCKRNNTTPTAITLVLGYSKGSMTHWKKGNYPSGEIIIRFARYFNVSADYLLGLTDSPMPLNTLSPEDIEALENGRKINDLPARDRKIVETILETKDFSRKDKQ